MRKLMYTLVGAAIFTACFLTPTTQTFAQDKPAGTESRSPEQVKVKRMPFRGRIHSVDPEQMTFVLPGKKKDRIFRVTPKTKVIKHGVSAKLTDAAPGEIVGGLAYVAVEGPHEVISLRIGPKPGKASDSDSASGKPAGSEAAPKTQ